MNIDLNRDVYAALPAAPAAELRAMLESDRNRRLLDTRGHGYYLLDPARNVPRRLRGLTTVLEQMFWSVAAAPPLPAPAVQNARRKTTVAGKRRSFGGRKREYGRKKASAVVRARPVNIQTAVAGMVRGSLVHRQVEDMVTLNPVAFWRRNTHGAHPWALQYIRALVERGGIPVASEFVVASEALDLATSIDGIAALRDTGEILFVELKTGYENGAWTASAGRMRGCLAHLDDTPLHRAMVQVVCGALLAISSHRLTGPFQCWVVRVTSSDVAEVTVVPDDFIRSRGPRIWAELVRR